MKRRVVITGLGVISPNGVGKDKFWEATINGKSSVELISQFDAVQFKSRIVSNVKGFDMSRFGLTEEQAMRLDRYAQFAVIAVKMAVDDSKLNFEKINRKMVGVSIGNAICGTPVMEKEFVSVTDYGKNPINPNLVKSELYQASMFNSLSNEISAIYGTKGICITIPTGCTAGIDSMGFSFESIRQGDVDMMITGASEAPITPITLGAFDIINCLSTRNDEPMRASRPFDKKRDGFVLAEGCGILILEELEHALKRRAHIYAEIVGFATGCNAFHMTDLSPDGMDLARIITLLLKQSGLKQNDISYISAHGSSTKQNDRNETAAIKHVFGDYAYKIPMSSLKSMIGHPLAAANSIESVASLLMMENNIVHPTVNYEEPDPDCDLDYVPNKARECKINVILKIASGFSGIHSGVMFKKYN